MCSFVFFDSGSLFFAVKAQYHKSYDDFSDIHLTTRWQI
jgi:hypothetical protein